PGWPNMIVLILPVGRAYGWGNCGRWITRELAGLTDVHLIDPRLRMDRVTHEIEYAFFLMLTQRLPELAGPLDKLPERVELPFFTGIGKPRMEPDRKSVV